MAEESRSPIKDPPLRTPGQSIREERESLLEDKVLPPIMFSAMLIYLTGMEFWRAYHPVPPVPWHMLVAAICVSAFTGFRIWRLRPKLRSLRLALDGELVVGQFLERLHASGYRVFHDIVGMGFNLDHVIVGPAGIFTLETKTWSKPTRGAPTILVSEGKISIAGYEPERDPIVQAKSQSAWLRQVLEDSTAKRFHVHPVVLFPGWFIEQTRESKREVWVLEPKALPGFLKQANSVLSESDVALAASHLSRFVRSTERSKSTYWRYVDRQHRHWSG